MMSVSIKSKETEVPAKAEEYKSSEGVRFRAKLMGNTVVDERRGKNIAEYAMAKLKLNIMKQKQHKTKVNISLKWDGFFVYLSDGGQELLHSFPLESISFVWKDPCDNRALGIIRSEGSAENNTLAIKFFGYKTEKWALPLIMSLKELFGLRANEYNDIIEEKNVAENGNDKNEMVDVNVYSPPSSLQEDKNELRSTTEDLLNLKIDLSTTMDIHNIPAESSHINTASTWNTFSNVNLFSTSPPVTAFQPSTFSIPSPWQQYPVSNNPVTNQIWTTVIPQSYQQFSNPFSQQIVYSQPDPMKPNIINPFDTKTSNVMQLGAPIISSQPMKSSQPKISKNQVDDLFSDLLTSEYGLESFVADQPSKNPLNSNGKEIGKISLLEMKNRQDTNPSMDLSCFDTNVARSIPKSNHIDSSAMPIPLFQFD